MPGNAITHLRIYCICGQKMKMSSEMFGRPGKCVACRQKIRVPRQDEIPEGVDTIYLRDSPEFLRKADSDPKSAPRKSGAGTHRVRVGAAKSGDDSPAQEDLSVAVADEAPGEVAVDTESERVSTVPIDVLDPLRDICSIGYKLQRKLKALDKVASSKDSAKRADLKRQLKHVASVRADLDEKLRQVLMEVAIELATTQEKIVQTGLSARVGEIAFDDYRETEDRLRRRRDRLERRQLNLRGWLATTDPHMAGGYVDLSSEGLPEDGFAITLPLESDEPDPLLNIHLNGLRGALRRRSNAQRKLAEMKRMQEGEQASAGYIENRADLKAERKIAEVTAAFLHDRLEQLARDHEKDMQAVDAQLDLARGRLQIGEIARGQFDDIESELTRAKTDAAKARAVINRALSANTAQDVPQLRGTFLERLASRRREDEVGVDSWIAWGAAIFLGVSIFLPAIGTHSLVSAFMEYGGVQSAIRWSFLGPIVLGVVSALVAGLPDRLLRGRLLLVAWLAGTIIGALAIQQAHYGLDAMSTRFRGETPWYIRPGMFMMICAQMALLAAAAAALFSIRRERIVVLGVGVAGLLAVGGIFSDVAGVLVPKPAVSVSAGIGRNAQLALEGLQPRNVSVTNNGFRTLHLVTRISESRGAYLFAVERRIGANSWSEVALPGANPRAAAVLSPESQLVNVPDRAIHSLESGQSVRIPIGLAPGEYRVLLRSSVLDDEIDLPFRVDEPLGEASHIPEPPSARIEPPDDTQLPETMPETADPDTARAPAAGVQGTELKLTGILTPEEGDPKFSVILYTPDGLEQRLLLSINDVVDGRWAVTEYNPQLRTVTLSTEQGGLLILRTGERIGL